MPLKMKPFVNIVGKGENVGNHYFLLFPLCFLPFPFQIFQSHLSFSSPNTFKLEQPKNFWFYKELNGSHNVFYLTKLNFLVTFILLSANAFNLDKSQIGYSVEI